MLDNKLPVLADIVYQDLLRKIMEVEFKPGEKISENDIAQRYNVSRSVIRSAFSRLKEMNFIEVYPQRGSFVSTIDIEYIENILNLRSAIEKEMLARVLMLPEATKEEIRKKLKRNLEKQLVFHDKNYSQEFRVLDEEFHNLLIESASGEGVMKLISPHLNHMVRWRNMDIHSLNRVNQLIDDHKKIYEALVIEDINILRENMASHLLSIYEVSNIMKKKFPQYFK